MVVDPNEVIVLDDDMILERQRVRLGNYTVTLDPAAHTTRLEIKLSQWHERSAALIAEGDVLRAAGEFDAAEGKYLAERDYVAGLLEEILQAKALPVDLQDIGAIVGTLEGVYRDCVKDASTKPLAMWIEDTRERMGVQLNPGWDRATIAERLSGPWIYRALFFFRGCGNGDIKIADLQRHRLSGQGPGTNGAGPGAGSSGASSAPTRVRATRTK